jgi:hypothetical protein
VVRTLTNKRAYGMANSTRRPINNRKDDKEMAMFDNIRAQYFSSSMASLNVKTW